VVSRALAAIQGHSKQNFRVAERRVRLASKRKKEDVARLPASAAQLYADTTLFPQPTKWRDAIPWMLDLQAGIQQAKEEKRLLLIWTSGDDPLERC